MIEFEFVCEESVVAGGGIQRIMCGTHALPFSNNVFPKNLKASFPYKTERGFLPFWQSQRA
ncbi:hypothetical protein BI350_15845 [Sporosarcina ureilytica]|uniref:Uncharacterized protein n=1 Tax=Sporosarcina ureilytica TaxID=298596 RepID=A0A1D8JJJ6_9BACL|nr:hypothetical protein BI350_15845 [Sporosarcina ureilytica]